MRKPTEQQKWLGWQDIDLSTKHVLCMCRTETGHTTCLSAHTSLTSALHRNGNRARDWRAEGGGAEEQTYGRGIFLLSMHGRSLKLYVDHIDRNQPTPLPLDHTPLKHEAGARGRSDQLLGLLGE